MAHFQSQNCLIITPTEVKKLEGVSFCPYKFYSSVHLAKLTISITPNLQVTLQDTGHQASIFFPQAKNVFPHQCPFQGPLRIPAIQCGFTMQKPLHVPLNGSEVFVTILSHCTSRIELPPKLLSKLLGCCHRKPFLHSLECSI
jgi:hypothetical protein